MRGGLGGHTLARHVGKTRAYLDARLASNPYLREVSSFHTVQDAEGAINSLMRLRSRRVAGWAASAPTGETLELVGPVSGNLGVVLARGAANLVQGRTVKVVLKKQACRGMPYFVLTAYLELQ